MPYYYPFGMEIAELSKVKTGEDGYRYALPAEMKCRLGFNGKEKDQSGEFGGNTTYDYGFRIYNPAIAKFLSVDPLTSSYPWYTPYQFAGNKPIWAIDLDGLEESLATDKSTEEAEPQLGLVIGTFILKIYEVPLTTPIPPPPPTPFTTLFGRYISRASLGGIAFLVGSDNDRSDFEEEIELANLEWRIQNGDEFELWELDRYYELLFERRGLFINSEGDFTPSKNNLERLRRWAVAEAWRQERALAIHGKPGMRDWSDDEMEELITTGKVKGYEGHHINNVNDHKDQAGDPDNVTFLHRKDHFDAHGRNWGHKTEGETIDRSERYKSLPLLRRRNN